METPTIEELEAMPPDEVGRLPVNTLFSMTPVQVQAISPEQIEAMRLEQLRTLLTWRHDLLSPAQRQVFSRGIENAGITVPKVDHLYSRMLEGIQKGMRLLDQSVFGPTYDPGADLCGTPMCIAGHIVNLAGEAGYRLLRRFGWGDAATLIHFNSRPDVPRPSYGNYLTLNALAYIQERAAEEV